MVLTDIQKQANIKWKLNHPEAYNAYKKLADKIYYERHKANIIKRQAKTYHLKKEWERIRNILVE